MSLDPQPRRIEYLPFRRIHPAVEGEERTVLRLSRESLRADHPAVRFVDKMDLTVSQGRLPWSA